MPFPKAERERLTERQREVLDFIQAKIQRDGYPPTIREIGDQLGIRSTNGVNDHLKALAKKGYLQRTEAKSRACVPTDAPVLDEKRLARRYLGTVPKATARGGAMSADGAAGTPGGLVDGSRSTDVSAARAAGNGAVSASRAAGNGAVSAARAAGNGAVSAARAAANGEGSAARLASRATSDGELNSNVRSLPVAQPRGRSGFEDDRDGLSRLKGEVELVDFPHNDDDEIDVPILGRIAAGQPILALEREEDTVRIDRMFLGKRNDRDVFALRVVGESMIEDGINDGDFIFVRKQREAPRGAIVVALIEDEATVKRFYPEGDKIRFQPSNSAMKPIYVSAADFKQTHILGVVVGIYRRMD